MKTLALTRPAKFHSCLLDTARLTTNVGGNEIYKDTGIRAELVNNEVSFGNCD